MLYGYGYDASGIEVKNPADAEFIAASRTDVPDMSAALRAVLELHKRKVTMFNFATYDECEDCECDWPCPTVETIRQHLGDEQ